MCNLLGWAMNVSSTVNTPDAADNQRQGLVLVFLAALCWSLGGVLERFVSAQDPWTIIFWRSFWAALSLMAYMFWRDGVRGTWQLFIRMGIPGVIVACCFMIATSAFIVALSYTTVANVLLMQAGGPLFAALLAYLLYGERVAPSTWFAIVAVLVGVGVMVSGSLTGNVSPIGDGLALAIVFVFSIATVLTRRYADVRMTPAMCLGTMMAGVLAATQASTIAVIPSDMGFLFAFGAINLGLGLAFFATGARMIPAAYAALLATFETLLGPVWVWLVHGEVPSMRTLIGGAIVFAALLAHIGLQFRRMSRPMKPGVTGIVSPH